MDEYEQDSCGCGVEARDRYDLMEQRFMQMTFWAHKAALFDKLKEKIEKQEGKELDQLADLLIANSKEEAKSSKAAFEKSQQLRNKIQEIFPN
jgi:uncharacterized protein (DUF305 family)